MENALNKIAIYLQKEKPVPGISIMIQNKQFSRAFTWGYFSEVDSEAVKENTTYDLASITKLYTSLLILKLHEKGELNIHDYCSKYLSSFCDSELKIIDLLTHKANFGIRLSDYREKFENKLNDEIYKITPPIFPSNEVHYENITFIYLGKIIEIVCNQPLSDSFLDLFKEYDLHETHLGVINQTEFISPPTERRDGDIIQNITHDETAKILGGVAGNAGIFSSARDLVKFGNIWLNNKTYRELGLKNYSSDGQLAQGLGWWNRVQGVQKITPDIFCHSGFTGGIIFIHLPTSTSCVMLTNRTYYGRSNLKHQVIWNILLEYLLGHE